MMRRIEIGLPTRNRPDCIPMMLQALRTQDYVHWDLTIVDDNDPPLLRDNLVVQRMLWLLEMEGHRWRVLRGVRQGPHYAHNVTLVSAEHDWVLRIDDDLVPQPTFISTLVETTTHYEKALPVGAIGGVYPEVASGDRTGHQMSDQVRAALPQFAPFESVEQRFLLPGEKARLVKALYSSFLYDRVALEAAGGFSLAFSRRGEKEETDATLRLFMRGAGVILEPKAQAWHLAAPAGGARMTSQEQQPFIERDNAVFEARVRDLADGSFDWDAERRANLSSFERYRQYRHAPSGFYGDED